MHNIMFSNINHYLSLYVGNEALNTDRRMQSSVGGIADPDRQPASRFQRLLLLSRMFPAALHFFRKTMGKGIFGYFCVVASVVMDIRSKIYRLAE